MNQQSNLAWFGDPQGLQIRMNEEKRVIINEKRERLWDRIPMVESLSPDIIEKIFYINNLEKREKELERIGVLPFPTLSQEIIIKLPKPNKFNDRRIPVSLELIDGSIVSCAYLVDKESFIQFPILSHFIKFENVKSIMDSPFTMPLKIRNELSGENSMGSMEFRVTMKDGKIFACWYENLIEFIELPNPYVPNDIVKIESRYGMARNEKEILIEPDYILCPCSFEKAPEKKKGVFKRLFHI